MVRLAGAALAAAWLVQQLAALPVPSWLGFAVPCLALVVWCTWGGRAACCVMLAGWALLRAGWVIEGRWPEALASTDVVVQGTVCDFPRRDPDAIRLVLATEADTLLPGLPARLHLSWYDTPPDVRPGARWRFVVRLKPPRGLSNPGAFDFEQWLYLRGIGGTGYVRRSSLNRSLPADPLACPVSALRSRLAARIGSLLEGRRAAPYVVGVAVGATHGLQQSDWEILRRTGTTHLMAISGLNIAMVAVPFLALGTLAVRLWPSLGIRFPSGPGMMPALFAAAGYSALAGFEVSTLRALVMLLIAALFARCGRAVTGPDILGAAAVGILILDPPAVLSAGFWLSFAGVGCLILAAAGLRRMPATGREPAVDAPWMVAGRHAATFGRVQLVLAAGLAPLTIAWFAQVSIIAPLTNLLAVPLFSFVVMPLTLAGTALLALDAGALPLQWAASALESLIGVLERVAGWPVTIWQPPPVGTAGLALAGVAVLILCWPRPLPVRWAAALMLVPLVAGTGRGPDPGDLRVVVMDVGQGLSVLVQTANHALLYDAGPAFRTRDAGDSVVLPALRDLGVRKLDVLVVSHDDADHKGGAASVLRGFPAARLLADAPGKFITRHFERCETGRRWSWDGIDFAVIGPDVGATSRMSDNDASCMLVVRSAGHSLLLPGDISQRREAELVRRGVIPPVDLVLAPHHGSRSSSGAAIVAATRPRLVVVSAGYRNRWGFPAAEVRERWERAGSCTLATADTGALIVEFRAGSALHIRRRQRIDGSRVWTAPPIGRHDCGDRRAGQ